MTLLWNENPMFSTALISLAASFHRGYENSHMCIHTWKHAPRRPGRKSTGRP